MNFNVNAWRKELASERRESSPKRSNGPMSYIVKHTDNIEDSFNLSKFRFKLEEKVASPER